MEEITERYENKVWDGKGRSEDEKSKNYLINLNSINSKFTSVLEFSYIEYEN